MVPPFEPEQPYIRREILQILTFVFVVLHAILNALGAGQNICPK